MDFSSTRAKVVGLVPLLLALAACGGGGDVGDGKMHIAGATAARLPADVPSAAAMAAAASGAGLLTRYDAGEYLQPLPDAQTDRLLGIDTTASGQPEGTSATYSTDPGRLSVQYQGGDVSERFARLVEDPVKPGNRVLAFVLRKANVREANGRVTKGRVQMNAYDERALRAREVRMTTRVFFPGDIDLIRHYKGTVNWLTISEWWNDASWTSQPFPFRVKVDIVKPSAVRGSALNFSATAQQFDPATNSWGATLWQVVNRTVPVPIGKWVTLEYAFLEGDANTGRFYMAMTPDGGARRVLIDARGWTHHPGNPNPDGLTHLNPLKLYTSKAVIDHVRGLGGELTIYWDDLGFRMCADRTPEETSACAPASFGSAIDR